MSDAKGSGASRAGKPPRNQFKLPSDEEVFLMREEEKERKAKEREEQAEKRIWEKTTQATTMGSTIRARDLPAALEGREGAGAKQSNRTQGLVAAATAAMASERRHERETMSDFISKKREMFLVQMSLDTKRDEIRKLEEKARMKEQALRRSELILEEDAMRFETFLKEVDARALAALKQAEEETKKKQTVTQEVKKLTMQIQGVESEMAKLQDQLGLCEKYKRFLDDLTPKEFFEEQEAIKQERKARRRREREDKILAAWEAERDRAVAEAEAQQQEAVEKLMAEGRSKKRALEMARTVEPRVPPKPDVESITVSSSGEEVPMYFTEPHQLLDLFTNLEEKTLFLIQNSQETEQALEELRQQYDQKRGQMDSTAQELEQQIDALRSQIAEEEAKAEALKRRTTGGEEEDDQAQMLDRLRDAVREVYQQCSFDGSTAETLPMLTDMEARLEQLLGQIEHMDPAYVRAAEKEKARKRREAQRLERQAEEERKYEEKLAAQLRRAQQPVHVKTGKPVMFRSRPLKKKVKKVENKGEKEAQEIEERYFQLGTE